MVDVGQGAPGVAIHAEVFGVVHVGESERSSPRWIPSWV